MCILSEHQMNENSNNNFSLKEWFNILFNALKNNKNNKISLFIDENSEDLLI